MTRRRIQLPFLQQWQDEVAEILGTVISKPLSAFLGDPVTEDVFANDEKTLVYIHGIGGTDDGTLVMPKGGIPKDRLTPFQPILVKRTDNGTFRYIGIDTQADRIYSAGSNEEPDTVPVYHNQIRWGTLQLYQGLQLLLTSATYGTYYIPDQLTGVFDGTATDTSAVAINAPATNNRYIGVLVQLDATTNTLEYKQSSEISASISLQTAYANNFLPATDANRLTIGYIRLVSGATAFTASDIWNYFPVYDDGTSGTGALGYPDPVVSEVTLQDGYTLLVESGWVIGDGGKVVLGDGSKVVLLPEPDTSLKRAIATKTSDYTITSLDSVILADGSSGAVTITLPDATTVSGYQFDVKAVDITNTVKLATSSSQTIDGDSNDITYSAQYESITVISDGSNWSII